MDASGLATVQDAQSATDWQDLPEWKSWGYGKETVWLRLQLKAAAQDTGTPWAVRVRPSYLDYVTLYDPAAKLVLRSGDALPPSSTDVTSINFTFEIPPLPNERTVYLQIRTTSSRMVNAQVMPYGQAQQLNRLHEWGVGFIMASSAIFAIWAFFQWLGSRDKIIGAFALKQFFATGWAFSILGFARVVVGPWLPEGLLNTITAMFFVGLGSTTLWFFSTLIEGYQPARLVLRAIRALAVAMLTLPILIWLGQPNLIPWLLSMSVLPSLMLVVLALLTALPKQVEQLIPHWVLLAYLLVYAALNTWPSLILLGLTEANRIALFGNLAHTVLDGLVMFALLQFRAKAMSKAQMQTTLDLQRSQQQAEDEKRHREEQSQLFAMLAHEMKTPLATLRMWMEAGGLKRETLERVIADMNLVIERCVHTGQLADQGLRAIWQDVHPITLTHSCIQACHSPQRVDFVQPATSESLNTDPQMLSIVLSNLLDNACKYGAPQSRIEVRLTREAQQGQAGWCWHVSNPIGLADLPDRERLFEKYYRGPKARRLSGSGLGLFLVKGLLNLLQGKIHYAVQDGNVVFSVWLPDTPIPVEP